MTIILTRLTIVSSSKSETDYYRETKGESNETAF